jgi:phosphate transport system permease protein
MKDFWKSGDPFIWLTGGALVFSLLMVVGLILLIMSRGLGFFWPSDVALVELKSGERYMGQITGRERLHGEDAGSRIQLKIGNRDLYGLDFKWVNEDDIERITYPKDAVVLERREWGNFYGFLKEVRVGSGSAVSAQGSRLWDEFSALLPESQKTYSEIKRVEKEDIGHINYEMEKARLAIKEIELLGKADTPEGKRRTEELNRRIDELKEDYKRKEERLSSLYTRLDAKKVLVESVDGNEKLLSMGTIVRAYKPNAMGKLSKTALYFSKLGEFLFDDPRESNTEGGVFPAIFGTVMLVLLMSIAVLPFGVLAAVYLREYAKQGPLVRLVRICVNNLAGVPSIVFGVFGLGFFIYGVGGTIDRIFFEAALPTPTYGTGGILWASLTLALLTVPVVIVAAEEGLAAVPQHIRHGSLALGATKFETLRKVVIPSALPGILTGLILAIARATGEVAPLMITGVVKLAPALPIDGNFPYIHFERKFMHLGFHIYDVGFQSPNVEAAKPMVYATAFLLIAIVVVLNIAAISLRNRLKKKYYTGAF